ncbi:amino acid ABC transporter substrate-binding protein, PAAT family [Alkalispirochaeta americana]|uniref:Amino acid ABC transporter substrate-binding protein, PAAT family n=1 Tax=Alkalispirochaeta americana TaxID=159291 RepID=A0A1N6N5S8_9SPIO|nr:ABC transporter substrate-binding protein [Alkalispirochaeta americana]SIP87416.1 amino acid ABC transporter substrate-binding protein, PAAT family [Alkalispirochaeta americana]
MKILTCGLICAGFMISLAGAQEVEILYDDDYAPYTWEAAGGEAKGIYIDVIREAIDRMDRYTLRLTGVPWRRGLQLVEAGRAFGLLPPYYRPEDRPYMDYPVAILDEGYALFALSPDTGTRWPEDFAGKRVGINAGFSVPDREKARDDYGIILDEAENNEVNLRKLVAGRIDYFINDPNSIRWSASQLRESDRSLRGPLESLQKILLISTEQGYLGIANTADAAFPFRRDFTATFVTVINEMKRDGTIDNIMRNYQ